VELTAAMLIPSNIRRGDAASNQQSNRRCDLRAFATFEREPNLKFDKLYEVYSQSFQQGD
jgi:hypothetical protein